MKLLRAIGLFLGTYPETTRRSYSYVLHDLAGQIGPDRDVASITPILLEEYLQTVRARPRIKSPASVNKYVKTVRVFMNWCVKKELLDRSPASSLERVKEPRSITREKAMKDDELEKILDYVKWDPRRYALILFLADTGCRAGGAAGLRVGDLDLEGETASVTEKGKPPRRVFFFARCTRALAEWLVHAGRLADPDKFVFSRHGEPITSAAISQIVRRACKSVGVRSLGSHSLRHRKGHQLADSKVAPSVAATALGHENVMTTLKNYYPADYDSAQQALRELAVPDPEEKKIIRLDVKKRID